jgi:hypothetical protein
MAETLCSARGAKGVDNHLSAKGNPELEEEEKTEEEAETYCDV